MSNEGEVHQVEISIEQARSSIALGDALDRLGNNADFKLVFLDNYLREEPIRLTRLKAAPAMRGEEQQKAIIKSIDGIGEIIQHLGMVEAQAEMARNALEADEATLQELYSEGIQQGGTI